MDEKEEKEVREEIQKIGQKLAELKQLTERYEKDVLAIKDILQRPEPDETDSNRLREIIERYSAIDLVKILRKAHLEVVNEELDRGSVKLKYIEERMDVLGKELGKVVQKTAYLPNPGEAYTVTFTDEAGNAVLGEFRKTLRWGLEDKGGVAITEWDDQAQFRFKDKTGKEHKVANELVKKRVIGLARGMTGQLKGNVAETIKGK